MPLAEDALEPLLRLALVQGIGPGRLATLVALFGDADAVLRATPQQLGSVGGIGSELTRRIRAASGRSARAAARNGLARLRDAGAVALTQEDPSYPAAFLHLPDAPYLLFAQGDLDLVARPALAVVGTRVPTHYGRSTAERLSFDLSMAGYIIISGMARGIDTIAHRAALDAGGYTIGVLGHGIDQVYPSENRDLFAKVRDKGLLLTEYPPGESPKAGNFPRRNRLITALGIAVVVVEMSHRSGAQHTVGYALEQGKEVFAVPGPITSVASQGTNQLIKDGARLVASALDVIEELNGVGAVRTAGIQPLAGRELSGAARPQPPAVDVGLPLLTNEEGRLLESLSNDPRHIDELSAEAALPAGTTLATLLELELRGLVDSLPGKLFRRV